jgi:selenocysteine-specific elongation factor
MILLDKEMLYPGEDALVQFRLEERIAVEHGDSYVIRLYSPMRTIGGGMILDANPPKHKQFRPEVIDYLNIMENGSPKERIEQILLKIRCQAITEWDIVKASNIASDEVKSAIEDLISDGKIIVFGKESNFMHIDWYNKAKLSIVEALRLFHSEQPLKTGMSREELRTSIPYEVEISTYNHIIQDLISEGVINTDKDGKTVRIADHNIKLSETHERIRQQIEEVYLNAGTATPLPEDVLSKWSNKEARIAQEAFDVLVEIGVLIRADEKVFFHKQTIDKVKESVIQHIRSHGKLTLNECKELLGVSRKYMLPLLYHFDKTGVTLRIGDDRVLKGNTR